jgi:hypothetical protein
VLRPAEQQPAERLPWAGLLGVPLEALLAVPLPAVLLAVSQVAYLPGVLLGVSLVARLLAGLMLV